MKLRVSRIHEQGRSNVDFRPKKYERPEFVTRQDFLATSKSNQNFEEILKTKTIRSFAHPIEVQEKFYKTEKLDFREKSILHEPYESHLEEKDEMKIFTGDSHLIYDRKVKYGYNKPLKRVMTKLPDSEKLANQKHDIHSEAIQETQLVGLEKRETLEGKIDLENVREIRKALRRRYANRKNFQKIFSSWDTDGSGSISPQKVYDMINKMGIKINLDEARVLIASADENQSGSLNLNSFMYLIFNSNEALNVDLHKLPVMSEKEMEELMGKGKVVELLAGDIQKNRAERKEKQLNVILKNKLESITTQVLNQDSLNMGFITFEKFEIAMKKIGLPSSVMDDTDIRRLYDQYKKDEHRFDYKKFISSLKNYNFVLEDLYKPETQAGESLKKNSDNNLILHQQITNAEKPIQIFDVHEMGSWQMETTRAKANKVFKAIGRYFTSKQEFENFMKNQVSQKEPTVSKQELTKFFKNVFLTVGENEVSQSDLEGFLSAFRYNKHGYTPLDEISQVIYDETDKEWLTRLEWKKNRPPPPSQKLFHEEFPKENVNISQDQVILQKNGWKEEGQETSQIPPLQQESVTSLQVQTQPTNSGDSESKKEMLQLLSSIKGNKGFQSQREGAFFSQHQGVLHNSGTNRFWQRGNLERILEKVETRLFAGSTKAQEVFRSFDIDKDGYVSQKDLVLRIKELSLLDHEEIAPFLRYVDPNQQGYMNFNEFSTKIRSGMTMSNPQGLNTTQYTILPNGEKNEINKTMLPMIKTSIQDVRKSLRPDFVTIEENMKTRFGATPMHKNTFLNVEASAQSPMYSSNVERFDTSNNHRVQFQKEEMAHKLSVINARALRRRNINDKIDQQVEDKYIRTTSLYEDKLKLQGYKKWAYEHRAHLLNDWN